MKRILDFLKSAISNQDLMDTEMYVQIIGPRITETGIPKAKAKSTIIREEDGNKITVNITEIGRIDCGHFHIELSGQCCVCGTTYCKYCISKNIGLNCVGCGRYCCPSCARISTTNPEIAVCSNCSPSKMVPYIMRKYLCDF